MSTLDKIVVGVWIAVALLFAGLMLSNTGCHAVSATKSIGNSVTAPANAAMNQVKKQSKKTTTPAASSPSVLPKWVAGAGVVLVAGGVAATVFGLNTIGLPLVASGLTIIVLVITITKYGNIIAAGGALALFSTLAAALFVQLRRYKVGLTEVVSGVQALKQKLTVQAKATKDEVNAVLTEKQVTPTTPKLVAAVKAKLGKSK